MEDNNNKNRCQENVLNLENLASEVISDIRESESVDVATGNLARLLSLVYEEAYMRGFADGAMGDMAELMGDDYCSKMIDSIKEEIEDLLFDEPYEGINKVRQS
ncbi:MAG: hypothetical protein AB9836_14315 [Aminipila sp.]